MSSLLYKLHLVEQYFLFARILDHELTPRDFCHEGLTSRLFIHRSPFPIGRLAMTCTPLGPEEHNRNSARVTRSYAGRQVVVLVQTCLTSALSLTFLECMQWQAPV